MITQLRIACAALSLIVFLSLAGNAQDKPRLIGSIDFFGYSGLTSRDTEQRVVAAHLLGYARQSPKQISYLIRAAHDADEVVRNNATRALGVLADSSPRVAAQIPAGGFIRMLSSGSWSDRNKASGLLNSLTRSRAPKQLAELRSQALVPLIEMARWRSYGHAYSARILLARIAGIDEERARQLANADNADEIINALGRQP